MNRTTATSLDLIRVAYEMGRCTALEADEAAYQILTQDGPPMHAEPEPETVRKYGRPTAIYMARQKERPDLRPMAKATPNWRTEPVVIRSYAHPESRFTGGGALIVWAQLSPMDSTYVPLHAHNLSEATPPEDTPADDLAPFRSLVDKIQKAL